MLRLLHVSIFVVAAISFLQAQSIDIQNYRTYSGESNNLSNPEWGQAGTDLIRITPIGYTDGFETSAGPNRPNPRIISNELFAQPGLVNDPLSLSDFCWVWGQFIDHDIGQTPDGPEDITIQVPAGDTYFDPFGMGQAIIPMHRNIFNPTTGTSSFNPRQHPNMITAFIDGSNVYGSDEDRANWLRTFQGGKLKVSSGNLLPFNTDTGEFDGSIDPDAPGMDNATGISSVVFVAGDSRASENPLLFSFHTLFVREHNRQCELLAASYPDWNDEELYQHARKIIGGMIQSIVYDEWLPAMGVLLSTYDGYDATVNPQLFNIFTGAAFRMGHTLLNGTIRRVDSDGNVIAQGNLQLSDAFFNPYVILETGGIEPFLQGMGSQIQQGFDAKVIDDVRNFLFGMPGFGGLDLASININRGRERGFSDFNDIRESFGLPAYNFFQQVSANAAVFTRLLTLYEDINDIDPWVGMLAEDRAPGSLFGETVGAIMLEQFSNLRDGDRFFYHIDPVLSDAEKTNIQNTTLRDIIMYNTGINLMQDNVFEAMSHDLICDNMTVNVFGQIRTENGTPINQVDLELISASSIEMENSDSNGDYMFGSMPFCDLELLTPHRDDTPVNGVTTLDLVLIQKHILNIEQLDSPFKIIAADVNKSNSISTIDLIQVRKLILGINTSFANNTSWRFVWSGYTFEDVLNPLNEAFAETVDFESANLALLNDGFIAVKVGDVNGSAQGILSEDIVDNRDTPTPGMNLSFVDQPVEAGEEISVELQAHYLTDIQGFQFELNLEAFEIVSINSTLDASFYNVVENNLRFSWNDLAPKRYAESFFTLHLIAKEKGELSTLLEWSSHFSEEAYNEDHETLGINLVSITPRQTLYVAQNQPNPFQETTTVPYYNPEAQMIRFSVIDAMGRVVSEETRQCEAGEGTWNIKAEILRGGGYYFYEIATAKEVISKKMIVL